MPDVVITFTIPAGKVAEAVEAFCAVHPNITGDPLQWDGDQLSDGNWVKWRIKQWVNDVVNQGRRHVHRVNNPEPTDGDFAE